MSRRLSGPNTSTCHTGGVPGRGVLPSPEWTEGRGPRESPGLAGPGPSLGHGVQGGLLSLASGRRGAEGHPEILWCRLKRKALTRARGGSRGCTRPLHVGVGARGQDPPSGRDRRAAPLRPVHHVRWRVSRRRRVTWAPLPRDCVRCARHTRMRRVTHRPALTAPLRSLPRPKVRSGDRQLGAVQRRPREGLQVPRHGAVRGPRLRLPRQGRQQRGRQPAVPGLRCRGRPRPRRPREATR